LGALDGKAAGKQPRLHGTIDDDAGLLGMTPGQFCFGDGVTDRGERRLQRIDMPEGLGRAKLHRIVVG
jgi:hypothetical protein